MRNYRINFCGVIASLRFLQAKQSSWPKVFLAIFLFFALYTFYTLQTLAHPKNIQTSPALSPALSQDIYSFQSSQDGQRFESLIKEIRCLVCQNQSLADSNAPLANDLRNKIYHMILNKNSNQEIKDYLIKRYGEFILLQPLFNKKTWVLWLFPFLSVLFLIIMLRRTIFNQAARTVTEQS